MYANLNSDETMYDYTYNRQGAQSIMRAFFQYDEHTKHDKDGNKISKALSNGHIKIKPQDEPCTTQKNSTINTHSGRALGNIEKGEVCISYEKLKMVSPCSICKLRQTHQQRNFNSEHLGHKHI